MKYKRQSRIAKIIQEQPVKTHEQLVDILESEGMTCTQATVSRDIKELGLVKKPVPGGGSVYAIPNSDKSKSEEAIRSLGDTVVSIKRAVHTVVIRTYSGIAPAMCTYIDEMLGDEFLGSIAGDDTIFIIAENPARAEEFDTKLKGILLN